MRTVFVILVGLSILTACSGAATSTSLPSTATEARFDSTATLETDSATSLSTQPAESTAVATASDDSFTQAGISLPDPTCTGLTQPQTEGPYYTPDTPQRNSLLEEGMQGTRLILVGYVLDQNCQPLPNAWLDFWQANANGEYDNAGYRLRGHQFTDEQGRYYLETILPGLYSSRPIEHIHVKVRPEGGQEITSQLYFPQQPIDGLTVTIENKGEYLLGYFDFVVQK